MVVITTHTHPGGPIDGCVGCKGSGQVDQQAISQHELPTVLYRIVAPSLTEPAWYEDEDQVLRALEELAPPTEFAVIHRLTLDDPLPSPARPTYVWTRLYYLPPASRGRLVAHPDP